MARYNFETDLSIKGINKLISDLKTYKDVTLPSKVDAFVEALAKRGIKVAYQNVYGEFDNCVEFTYERTGNGEGEIIGKNTKLIHRKWYTKGGDLKDEYDISPILMAEFGAGKYAPSGWRGSLGKNGMKNAWGWYDADGDKHLSEDDPTIRPSHPLHNAFLEMQNIIQEVAQEVFAYE